jgi:4-amino-4-deoxy-L-arabinose transferase-like glycosyltransferase
MYHGVSRVINPIEGHVGGYLYYFSYLFITENMFWLVLLLFATVLCAFNAVFKRSKGDTFILVWMATVLAVFTLVQTKINWYILPAFPAFAIAIGSFIYQVAMKIQLVIRQKTAKATRETSRNSDLPANL